MIAFVDVGRRRLAAVIAEGSVAILVGQENDRAQAEDEDQERAG